MKNISAALTNMVSDEQKTRAGEITRQVSSVKLVVNNITVKPSTN